MRSADIKLRIRRSIARHRRSPVIHRLANFASTYLDGYYNLDYDHETNGEQDVLAALCRFHFPCIFDVGANIGDWTLLARRYFPQAHIYSFELMESTCENLRRRTISFENITVVCHGLSDANEDVPVAHDPHMPAATTIVTEFSVDRGLRETSASVMRGDDYAAAHNVTHIDFLKIDVEGAEHRVLAGFSRLLQRGGIDVIQFEYGTVNVITKWLLRDYYRFLDSYSYRIGKIYPGYVDFKDYVFKDEDFRGPNYLAVRAERQDVISALAQGYLV